MGVRLTLLRAAMLDVSEVVRQWNDLRLQPLRDHYQRWVKVGNIMGIRWTSEGTQQTKIEQLWRKISEVDARCAELDRHFDQTVEVFEAEAGHRLNQVLGMFQAIFVGFGSAGIAAQVVPEGWLGLPKWIWILAAGLGLGALRWAWLVRNGVLDRPRRPGWLPAWQRRERS